MSMRRADCGLNPRPNSPAGGMRWGGGRGATDFGALTTTGAVRCEVQDRQIVITPLPDRRAFTVEFDPAKLAGAGRTAGTITAVDRAGKTIGEVKAERKGARIAFTADEKAFAYQVELTNPTGR